MTDYKYPHLIEEFDLLETENPLLHAIVLEVENFCFVHFNQHAILTSIYREDDPGVHGVWRGVDIRGKTFLLDELMKIAIHVNAKYQYDPKRPKKQVLFVHGEGENIHMHLQTHPNTRIL